MNELYIVRHGIAVEPGTPGMPDDERPLTRQGREADAADRPRAVRKLELEARPDRHQPACRGPARRPRSSPTRSDARERLETSNVLADRLGRRDDSSVAARADRRAG